MTFFFQSVNSENTPDIYVKLALMNQTKEVKRKKTQIIKKNINPAFQESFNFKADENDIETIGVRVTAMQHMPFPEKGRKIAILGYHQIYIYTGIPRFTLLMWRHK